MSERQNGIYLVEGHGAGGVVEGLMICGHKATKNMSIIVSMRE